MGGCISECDRQKGELQDSVILIEDSRQQRLKHNLKRDYFRSKGIILRKEALDCGDYTLINDRSVVVDTKKDIQELIGDIHVKTMPLKEIEPAVHEIYEKYNLSGYPEEKMVRIIFDDDVGRYPEREILVICNEHDFPDDSEKEFQKLYVKRRGFFHRGLKRAEFGDVKLYVLVENKDGVKSIDDLFHWQNPMSNIWVNSTEVIGIYKNGKPRYKKVKKYPRATTGETLAKALLTMQLKYGVEFLFCRPEEAGEKILELLKVEE